MPRKLTLTTLLVISLLGARAWAVEERVLNDGNLVLQDVPVIPQSLVEDLVRYQNVRSAAFVAWDTDGGLYVRTRFGDVPQIHHVANPLGARTQKTFLPEPVGSVARQPGSRRLAFTMDAGGNELSQIFLLNPADGSATMLTDGKSRNRSILWDRTGTQLAFTSTRRNGRSNDVWVMDVNHPDRPWLVLASPDGSTWTPTEFSEDGKWLLIENYISANESRVYLANVETSTPQRLTDISGANRAVGFAGDGFLFVTDRWGEFSQLAFARLETPDAVTNLTADIPWDLSGMAIAPDRSRAAFAVNAGGLEQLYLFDMKRMKWKAVEGLPTGLISGLTFSPDSRSLGMTISTAQTPSDAFVLGLRRQPLGYAKLERWTKSEVGALDTDAFIKPDITSYPTFDGRNIPALVYRHTGPGPHPVVIAIHGGPEGQALAGFSSTYQMWVEKLGATVIRPNVRGSSGYGKTFVQLDNGMLREDSVKDIGALLDWVGTQPDMDASRVAVYGGSYGGYMVLASAVHYSDRLVAAVDVVGISNFVTFLENTQDYRRDLRRVEYGDERLPAMRAHLESISPLNHTDKITIPLLVVQGQNDPRVPVTESEQLVSRLRAQGQRVSYMNALNEGHGYRRKDNRDVYQQATVMFLRQYLQHAEDNR